MTNLVGSLYSLAALLFLWFIVTFLWTATRISGLRQSLFDLRAELFDLAARGALAFEHPAYRHLRLTLNSLIRFAHRINFLNFFYTLLVERFSPQQTGGEANCRWLNSISELPLSTRTELNSIRRRTGLLIAAYMLRIPASWLEGPDCATRQIPGKKPPSEAALATRQRIAVVVRELERQAIEERAREQAGRKRAAPQYV